MYAIILYDPVVGKRFVIQVDLNDKRYVEDYFEKSIKPVYPLWVLVGIYDCDLNSERNNVMLTAGRAS